MSFNRKTLIVTDPEIYEKKTPIISKLDAFSNRFKFSGKKKYVPLLSESDDTIANNPLNSDEDNEILSTKSHAGKNLFHREENESLPVKGFKRY